MIMSNLEPDKRKRKRNTVLTLVWMFVVLLSITVLFSKASAKAEHSREILFVLSSHEYGYWASELIEPYVLLKDAGYQVRFSSPSGGQNPVAGLHQLSDKLRSAFYESKLQEQLSLSIPLREINSFDYAAVYFVGGAGPMFDLISDPDVQRITKEIYENNGIVAADCHGPAALINVRLSNGQLLVTGRQLTAKANTEEGQWARDNYPFLLQDRFIELGANFVSGEPWKSHVIVDGRLITGQNPQSAAQMAFEMIKALNESQ